MSFTDGLDKFSDWFGNALAYIGKGAIGAESGQLCDYKQSPDGTVIIKSVEEYDKCIASNMGFPIVGYMALCFTIYLLYTAKDLGWKKAKPVHIDLNKSTFVEKIGTTDTPNSILGKISALSTGEFISKTRFLNKVVPKGKSKNLEFHLRALNSKHTRTVDNPLISRTDVVVTETLKKDLLTIFSNAKIQLDADKNTDQVFATLLNEHNKLFGGGAINTLKCWHHPKRLSDDPSGHDEEDAPGRRTSSGDHTLSVAAQSQLGIEPHKQKQRAVSTGDLEKTGSAHSEYSATRKLQRDGADDDAPACSRFACAWSRCCGSRTQKTVITLPSAEVEDFRALIATAKNNIRAIKDHTDAKEVCLRALTALFEAIAEKGVVTKDINFKGYPEIGRDNLAAIKTHIIGCLDHLESFTEIKTMIISAPSSDDRKTEPLQQPIAIDFASIKKGLQNHEFNPNEKIAPNPRV